MIGVEPSWVSDALGPSGLLVFLLVVVVWGGVKRWWVFGWIHEEVREERDMFRDMALRSLETAEHSAKVAEHVVTTKDAT